MHRRTLTLLATSLLFGCALLACGAPTDGPDAGRRRPPRDSGVTVEGEGLPCSIAATLKDACWSCHGAEPTSSAPYSLVSRADLVTAIADTTRGARVVSRMRAQGGRLMPPGGPPVDEAAIAEIEAWISMGAPFTSCGAPDAGGCVPCSTLITNISTCVPLGMGGMMPNFCNPRSIDTFICAGQQCGRECGVALPGGIPPKPCNAAESAGCVACIQTKCAAQERACQ